MAARPACQSGGGRNNLVGLKPNWKAVWPGAALVALTLLVYLPALRGGFVWDDDSWTSNISGLLWDFSGLRAIWFQPTALQQYYPLSGTTFWLDYQFWGFWTTPYHVENVVLHALAALLFWRLLLRLGVPGAWLAAALFALHPVMVESAAWITERKNVLSLVLFLGALLAYRRYGEGVTRDQCPVSGTDSIRSRVTGHGSPFYVLALVLFLGALLAKTTTFSLPAAMLLIGWWQRGRIRWRADVLPTLPFLALSMGLCLVTAWLEKHHVGAQGPDFDLTWPQRCLVAGRVPWFYLGKLLWPADLCFVYARWEPAAGVWWQWLFPAAAVGALAALWGLRSRMGRGPLTAALFYVGTLFPLLGFLNAYGMRYSFVWDHWVYLPSLGIFALVAALVVRAAEGLGKPGMVYGFGAIVLPVLGLLTWRQAGMYTDMETLWRTTLAKNPEAWMAHNNLGVCLFKAGRLDEAMDYFRKSVELKPSEATIHSDYGAALQRSGKLDAGEAEVRKALALAPNLVTARINLAEIFQKRGRLNEALEEYKSVLQLAPVSVPGRLRLADTLCQLGRPDEAIPYYREVVGANPDDTNAWIKLGLALIEQGNFTTAESTFSTVLKTDPKEAQAVDGLGYALAMQGRVDEAKARFFESMRLDPQSAYPHLHYAMCLSAQRQGREAIQEYRKALELNDQLSMADNNLAWMLASHPDPKIRNGREAVELGERACRLTDNEQPFYLGTLAAAYAEAGRFNDAVATAEKARDLARKAGLEKLAERNEQLLKLYRAGQPYREPAEVRP